jgi:hypothetical protein
VNDEHRQELLRSSAAYATARLSLANAIVIAQRAGETDEEIAHVTGYTVPDDPSCAPLELSSGLPAQPGGRSLRPAGQSFWMLNASSCAVLRMV